jgi:hypothetical protein
MVNKLQWLAHFYSSVCELFGSPLQTEHTIIIVYMRRILTSFLSCTIIHNGYANPKIWTW